MALTGCAILLIAASKHIGAQNKFNEQHESYGIACKQWSAGYYYNSEYRDTIWAAKRWTYGRPYFEAGAVAGYADYPVLPFVRAGYAWEYLEAFIVPAYETWNGKSMFLPVVGIQIKVPIK